MWAGVVGELLDTLAQGQTGCAGWRSQTTTADDQRNAAFATVTDSLLASDGRTGERELDNVTSAIPHEQVDHGLVEQNVLR